jgi:16S rRNA (cytidine1402-2'-O)-methyltransferase
MPAKLILFPSALQTEPNKSLFAPAWFAALPQVQGFVVETLRTSRRFLRGLDPAFPIDSYAWVTLREDGTHDLTTIHQAWREGKAWGLLSDAGYPAVGDPGAEVVAAAHRAGIPVLVLPGSCSFLMALAASGLGGQQFAFRGYVPIEKAARKTALLNWEHESRRLGQTQICMDTPYRNASLWATLLQELHPATLLCFAEDLEGPAEAVSTKTVGEWRKLPTRDWEKLPCVFLFVAK